VSFTVVQDTSNPVHKTARARLAAHATEPMCTGCHKITDPLGLSLENFDGVGRYRLKENGTSIDTGGSLDGIQFTDARGLGEALKQNPAPSACVVKRLYAYAMGRPPTKEENTWLHDEMTKAFAANGYKFLPLMRAVAISSAFRGISGEVPARPFSTGGKR
jgi:hypothetical protein